MYIGSLHVLAILIVGLILSGTWVRLLVFWSAHVLRAGTFDTHGHSWTQLDTSLVYLCVYLLVTASGRGVLVFGYIIRVLFGYA